MLPRNEAPIAQPSIIDTKESETNSQKIAFQSKLLYLKAHYNLSANCFIVNVGRDNILAGAFRYIMHHPVTTLKTQKIQVCWSGEYA